jgi:hypothetical protein
VERSLELPGDPDAQIETIALLSGNLARDEAGALLGQLRANEEDILAAEELEPATTEGEDAGAPEPSAPKSE